MMSDKNHDDELIKKVTSALDESTENLDAETLSRLNQARQHALEEGRRPSLWHRFRLPAAGLVAATLVLLVTTIYLKDPSGLNEINGMEDLELLASVDSIDFYSEIEFYSWLEEEGEDAV